MNPAEELQFLQCNWIKAYSRSDNRKKADKRWKEDTSTRRDT